MDSAFDLQLLAEKLSKLNSSQQSIETLSNWCILHRKKAKQVVETWENQFNKSPKERRVSFLYLANDILQNSRRQGSEYVIEFWKVLPGALKSVYKSGEHGKSVTMRLVGIWDERKVFGSRGRGLKDDILGKAPETVSEKNGRTSNTIKIVKKDAQSIRLKLAVGEKPEKIISAYHTVLDEHSKEDTALEKCKAAASRVENFQKDIDEARSQGDLQDSNLLDELQEQETQLKQCVEQLENSEATRTALLVQLQDAVQEQENKLEDIRIQLQAARTETDRASMLRQRLLSAITPMSTTTPVISPSAEPMPTKVATPPPQPPNTLSLPFSTPSLQLPKTRPSISPQSSQPATTFAASTNTAEDDHKKAAAAVAAKLAASTSSAQMLTSILSSLVAEEAASMNGPLTSGSFSNGSPIFPPEKKPKLDKPSGLPDIGSAFFSHMQQQQLPTVSSQPNQPAPPFTPPPPPMPPPLQQLAHNNGVMVLPYNFGGNGLPPPPPLPSRSAVGIPRPTPQLPPPLPPPPFPQQQQQQQQQQQPQTASSSFYPSQGISFFGQPQTAPTVARQ